MHRISGRILLITAAFALFLVPIAAIAAGGFEDVSDGNVFKADIQWLADAGVTKGCNPPTNTKFCPSDNVTREQMAAFMHRLAVNRVVDAATALEADHAGSAGWADVAGEAAVALNAENLDGKDSTAFAASGHNHNADYLAINGKAADADRLDGLSANQMTRVEEGIRTGNWWPNNNDQYMTATITAPKPGYIYATGSTTIKAMTGGFDQGECVLTLKRGGTTTFSGYVEWDVKDVDGSRRAICTPVALFYIAEAGTYDIGMEFNWYDSTKAEMSRGNVVAMYLPFDGGGAKP